jgi:hypothetical protein
MINLDYRQQEVLLHNACHTLSIEPHDCFPLNDDPNTFCVLLDCKMDAIKVSNKVKGDYRPNGKGFWEVFKR